MSGLELAFASGDATPLLALALGITLGLRHATDPDHLTAVLLIAASDEEPDARRSGLLGLAWGTGHAVTCMLLGLAVIAVGPLLPEAARAAAEVAVGAIVVAFALRLLLRWRRGRLHAHRHRHGSVEHSHPHVHEGEHPPVAGIPHDHAHEEALGRSPWQAFGVGLVHGVGGSAAAGALLVAPIGDRAAALAVLGCFALATALAMAAASFALGAALRLAAARRIEAWVPVVGVASLLFGVWYAVRALLDVGAAA